MSTTFFIAPLDPTHWTNPDDDTPQPESDLSIDPSDYRAALMEQWPALEFCFGCEACALEFELPLEPGQYAGLRGCLQANLQIVDFGTAPLHTFVEFIRWHRAYVPPRYPLYLFNTDFSGGLLLTRHTTEAEIIEFTGIIA